MDIFIYVECYEYYFVSGVHSDKPISNAKFQAYMFVFDTNFISSSNTKFCTKLLNYKGKNIKLIIPVCHTVYGV